MRHYEPDPSGSSQTPLSESVEESLRKEIEDLKRQLLEQKGGSHDSLHPARPSTIWRPSGLTITCIFLGVTLLLAIAFLAGYIPLQKRRTLITGEAREEQQALPRVEVIEVTRSARQSELELPGNLQAITEAPILARSDGYIQRRLVDIGDRVKAGQLLAEIEAPELDQQVRQAKASLQESEAALDQALANQRQGKATEELARVTADRWKSLVAKGVVSRQENDQYQAQYQAQVANLEALDKAIGVARGNIAASEANLARLNELEGFRQVKAPFDGVVTLRNVDVGALVNAGNTLLFRIAQTGTLRAYINVPQSDANSIRPGQPARLTISNLPGRHFQGAVARTANALDPTTRTLLVDVRVPNPDGALLPGMYAQVDLSSPRIDPPVLAPSDALIVRADGTQVALVRPDQTVHFQNIEVGRDYGDRIEVLSGLHEGDTLIPNPPDSVREGVKVFPVHRVPKAASPSK